MTLAKARKQRAVVVGNSLALPLREAGVRYDDTYPQLVNLALPDWDLIVNARRRTTVVDIARARQFEIDILEYDPTICIIHVGIVDCAPRVLWRWESALLNRLPSAMHALGKWYVRVLSPIRRTRLAKHYVSRRRFEQALSNLLAHLIEHDIRPLLIGISHPTPALEQKSPYLLKNIGRYNAIIREQSVRFGASYIEPPSCLKVSGVMVADGIHLSALGHHLLASEIASVMN